MPRKPTRRRAPGPPRFRWTKGDIIKFVACLDFSLQHQVDLNTTAICHLKKRIGREVTAKQVERVLRQEYETYGRNGDHHVFGDFLSEGSSFLDGYADIDREHIRDEVCLIETPRYLLRSTSLVSQSHSRTQSLDPRHQRSASSNGLNSPHPAADLEVLDGPPAQAGNSGKNQTHEQVSVNHMDILNIRTNYLPVSSRCCGQAIWIGTATAGKVHRKREPEPNPDRRTSSESLFLHRLLECAMRLYQHVRQPGQPTAPQKEPSNKSLQRRTSKCKE